ncbi:MAG: F0F1 ATP synthase subunit B [Pseudomonadales bacterium]
MTINWWTIALQAINFLVLVWLLQRFLYKPVLAVIARRKELVEHAFADAKSAQDAATAEQQRYQEAQQQLVESRQALLSKAHAEIEADRVKVIEGAHTEAASMVDSARAQIATERAAALTEMKSQVADLAVDIASQLLQHIVDAPGAASALNDAFLAQIGTRLDDLSAAERKSLSEDLEASTERLRVVTATELGSDARQRWRQAIEHRLGPAAVPTFAVDPQLLGGAELRFPHAVLSFAWSELLQERRAALLADDVTH